MSRGALLTFISSARMRWTVRATAMTLAVMTTAAAAPPTTGPATKPIDPADPPLLSIALEDLCQFRLQDGRLNFGTRLPFTGLAPRAVEVEGLPGTTKVSFRRLRFQLTNEHPTDAGGRVSLVVERRSSYFRLERTAVAPNGEQTTVVYTQTHVDDNTGRAAATAKPGQVRLSVTSLGEVLASAEAPDFQSLRRAEPRAFYRYLVPALRDLRAESVLAVDVWAARQALAERVPPERLPAAVADLVARLADPSFKVRESAMADLAGLGPEAMDELRRMDRAALSPQQSTAIEVLLKRHQPLTREEADALRDNVDYLLDCLYSDDAHLPAAALARLGKVTGRDVKIDLTKPPASRGAGVEALRAKLTLNPTTRPAGQ